MIDIEELNYKGDVENEVDKNNEVFINVINKIIKNQKEIISKVNSMEESVGSHYQLCPKCNGQGSVSKPPYIAGDVNQWSGTAATFVCDVCNGLKILYISNKKQSKEINLEESKNFYEEPNLQQPKEENQKSLLEQARDIKLSFIASGKDEIHLFIDNDEDRIRINTILDQLQKSGVDK